MADHADMGGAAQGEALRAAREAARLTQAHLASMAGVSTRTVMRVEGGALASADTIRAICAALKIDAATLPAAAATGSNAGPAEEVGPETADPTDGPASALGRPWHGSTTLRRAFLIAAVPVLAYFCLTLPTSVAVILGYTRAVEAGYPGDRTMLPFWARNAAKAIEEGMQARREGVAWDTAPRMYTINPYCRYPGTIALLLDSEAFDCSSSSFGLRTELVTGNAFQGSVGPLRPQAAENFLRFLDPDPGLKLRIAYGWEAGSPGEGTLWFDPRELADGQIPRPRRELTYLHISVERIGGSR
jgi:transcriptional regulator with XRE-family HTH domain